MMTLQIRTLPIVLATTIAMALSSCGSEPNNMTSNVKAKLAALSKIRALKKNGVVAPKPTAVPTRAGLAKTGKPMAYIGSPQTQYGGFAIQVAQNGDWDTYMTAEKYSVTVIDGIVTATRGFVGDLMSQELSISVEQMFDGPFPLEYKRTQTLLDVDITTREIEFSCVIDAPVSQDLKILDEVVNTHKYEEVCSSKTRAFQNRYWVETSNDLVIQSQQSVHPNTGFIVFQSIVR
jgi:hypothetical protein